MPSFGSVEVRMREEPESAAGAVPVPVAILAGLHLLLALVVLVAAFGAPEPALAVAAIVGALLNVALGLGLLTLARWAWWLTVVVYGWKTLLGVLAGSPLAVVPGAILAFLFLPAVRRPFFARPTETERGARAHEG